MKMQLKKEIQDYIDELTVGLYKGYELQLDELCKKLNLTSYVADFENGISGALIKDKDADTYSIYADRRHARSRRRFTFAHEIGHYISYLKNSYSKEELERNGGFEDRAVSYRKEGVSSDAETEANLIAANLLMPQSMVDILLKKGLTPEEMAEKFYVSPSAMTIRLQSLYPDLMVI